MTQRRALPKICIALGLPDVPRLLEQARREAEAGENFLEFRLDYLPDPAVGARAIAEFLAGLSELHDSRHLPPASEPWPIQRQHRGAAAHSRSGD